MDQKDIEFLGKLMEETIKKKFDNLDKTLDERIKRILIENKVIYPPEDEAEASKYLVYISDERLFFKCMRCMNEIEAGQRYVVLLYSEALALDPNVRSIWTKAQNIPHASVVSEKKIEDGAEIQIMHESCYDEMCKNHEEAKNAGADKSDDPGKCQE
jgi:hypothetical protein